MARRQRRDEPSWPGDYDWRPYVSIAERRRRSDRKLRALRRSGRTVSPVELAGRKIATTFWGCAWCDNLERYGDFANRLPRGRTYVRNGSVIDLQIGAGQVDALVSGTEIYEVQVKVAPVQASRWRAICARCAGGIDSLVELLQGRFSDGVMAHLCKQDTGLFPTPREIQFTCTCPDWASMCKHVAAVLYGVGARLDVRPELLFRLRKVDEHELVARAGAGVPLSKKAVASSKRLADEDFDVFGIELALPAADPAAKPATGRPVEKKPRKLADAPPARSGHVPSPPGPAVQQKRFRMDAATRKAIARRMKAYWDRRRRRTQD